MVEFISEHSQALIIVAVIFGLMLIVLLFMSAVGKAGHKYDMMYEEELKKRRK